MNKQRWQIGSWHLVLSETPSRRKGGKKIQTQTIPYATKSNTVTACQDNVLRVILARPVGSGLPHPTHGPSRGQTGTSQVSSQARQELGYKLNNSEKLTHSPVRLCTCQTNYKSSAHHSWVFSRANAFIKFHSSAKAVKKNIALLSFPGCPNVI